MPKIVIEISHAQWQTLCAIVEENAHPRKIYRRGFIPRIRKIIPGLITKGLEHERAVALGGFRKPVITGSPPTSDSPEPDRGGEAGNKKVQEPPICHGRPMIDYGKYWFCLVEGHRELKK